MAMGINVEAAIKYRPDDIMLPRIVRQDQIGDDWRVDIVRNYDPSNDTVETIRVCDAAFVPEPKLIPPYKATMFSNIHKIHKKVPNYLRSDWLFVALILSDSHAYRTRRPDPAYDTCMPEYIRPFSLNEPDFVLYHATPEGSEYPTRIELRGPFIYIFSSEFSHVVGNGPAFILYVGPELASSYLARQKYRKTDTDGKFTFSVEDMDFVIQALNLTILFDIDLTGIMRESHPCFDVSSYDSDRTITLFGPNVSYSRNTLLRIEDNTRWTPANPPGEDA